LVSDETQKANNILLYLLIIIVIFALLAFGRRR